MVFGGKSFSHVTLMVVRAHVGQQVTYQQEKLEPKEDVIKTAGEDAQIVYVGFGETVIFRSNPMAALFIC